MLNINRSKQVDTKIKPSIANNPGEFYVDYKAELQPYFNNNVPAPQQEPLNEFEKSKIRKQYKDHFLLCQEYKIIEQYRTVNES